MVQLSHRAAFALLLAALPPAVMAQPAKEPLAAVDDRWRHLQSPNFELYTHNAEPESRTLLHDLELLRGLFFERFKFVERSRLDVTVYSFRRRADFQAYGTEAMASGAPLGGFYFALPDRAVISLAPIDDKEFAQQLVFHEYVHHLFRAADTEPPPWFNEGMAELLSAIREDHEMLEIGRPHVGGLMTLQNEKLLPLETLFAVDYDSPIYRAKEHTGVFYAESWALLHFWYFGDSKLPQDGVKRFTQLTGEHKLPPGVDRRQLFRECFGIDYPEMQRRLDYYVKAGSYRFGRQPLPKIPPASSYVARKVPRDEIRLRLAELALRVNHSSMAKFVLLDAAAKGSGDPRVFEALGADAMLEQEEGKACELWEQALGAGSTNQAIYRELGLAESRQWLRDFNVSFRLPRDVVDRLRGRLQRAITYEPAQTAAYETLAWVEAFAETPSVANVNLIQGRFPTLQQKARTLVALALIRIHVGEVAAAKGMLADLNKLDRDDWAAKTSEIVLATLEDGTSVASPRPQTAEVIRVKPDPELSVAPVSKVSPAESAGVSESSPPARSIPSAK